MTHIRRQIDGERRFTSQLESLIQADLPPIHNNEAGNPILMPLQQRSADLEESDRAEGQRQEPNRRLDERRRQRAYEEMGLWEASPVLVICVIQ